MTHANRQRNARDALARDRDWPLRGPLLREQIETVFRRDGWRCQATVRGFSHECCAALHPHHVLPRARGGDNRLENLLAVCVVAHRLVHDVRPNEATERGLLRASWDA